MKRVLIYFVFVVFVLLVVSNSGSFKLYADENNPNSPIGTVETTGVFGANEVIPIEKDLDGVEVVKGKLKVGNKIIAGRKHSHRKTK